MADEKDSGIDLVKYGVLWQRVQDMDKKMDKKAMSAKKPKAMSKKAKKK